MLHHPYDSFVVVMDFLNRAADDPDVSRSNRHYTALGMILQLSALSAALPRTQACHRVVELKARFDERITFDWTRQMERAGVNVVYGFCPLGRSTVKRPLVVRMEGKHLRALCAVFPPAITTQLLPRSILILGLLTCDPEFGNDVSLYLMF